jgi:tetratricopeptide (TPR) repeat protein
MILAILQDKKHLVLVLFTLGLVVSAGVLNNSFVKPKVKIAKQDSAFNFNSDLLRIFSVGQKKLITDLLWITTLLESDLDHYKKKDLNSWIYLRFLSIFNLDPKFLNAYRFGGQYLSIVKDDLYGADDIFQKGLSHFPNDYSLNYNAGFLYGFELGEYEKAIQSYEKIVSNPRAPAFVASIINKFKYSLSGDLSLTFKVVHETYKNSPKDSHIRKKLFHDLYAIRGEIDLKCLNSKGQNCNRIDFNQKPYILTANGTYTSAYQFKKYRVYSRKKQE